MRAISALSLLVLRIALADHKRDPTALDDPAMLANRLDAASNLHRHLRIRVVVSAILGQTRIVSAYGACGKGFCASSAFSARNASRGFPAAVTALPSTAYDAPAPAASAAVTTRA